MNRTFVYSAPAQNQMPLLTELNAFCLIEAIMISLLWSWIASTALLPVLQVLQLPTLRFKFRLPIARIATQLESKKRQKSGSADNSPNGHLRPTPSNNQNVPKVSSMSPAPSLRKTSGNRRK